MILIQVGLDAVATTGEKYIEPLTTLARLHRVDRTFNSTIQGSAKLQNSMFAGSDGLSIDIMLVRLIYEHWVAWTEDDNKPPEPDIKLLKFPQTPLRWLMNHIHPDVLLKQASRSSFGLYFAAFKPDSNEERRMERLVGCLPAKMAGKEASWRKIKVVQSEESSERVSYAKIHFRRSKDSGRVSHYRESLEFPDGMLLGESFECLSEIACRSDAQHVEFAAAA
ncbi:uncharacterized protein RCC_07742 [Ramularia collo-cygni]|uniref:Uncharacterized protein n=1 Tax=Ramularia collo-cygni TaxID=112498 RepID=A0A2D3VDJ9_9PEZI|nr:uncharacterized protein RCC_07742 [Ramularia collo-cygni]CZT21876.1 uncharacterized protein RCC_07742 [Ramularia collo-cygni]